MTDWYKQQTGSFENESGDESPHSRLSRRTFFADAGMGVAGMALSAMLHDDGYAATSDASEPDGQLHFPAKAKSVIWLFMAGGVSHMESFDIKPALDKYAGMTYDETPYKDFIDKERIEKNLAGAGSSIPPHKQLMGLQTGWLRYGECGLPVGNWFSHMGTCALTISPSCDRCGQCTPTTACSSHGTLAITCVKDPSRRSDRGRRTDWDHSTISFPSLS